jgi:hypothetical protein
MNQAWLITMEEQGFCQRNRRVALRHSEKMRTPAARGRSAIDQEIGR